MEGSYRRGAGPMIAAALAAYLAGGLVQTILQAQTVTVASERPAEMSRVRLAQARPIPLPDGSAVDVSSLLEKDFQYGAQGAAPAATGSVLKLAPRGASQGTQTAANLQPLPPIPSDVEGDRNAKFAALLPPINTPVHKTPVIPAPAAASPAVPTVSGSPAAKATIVPQKVGANSSFTYVASAIAPPVSVLSMASQPVVSQPVVSQPVTTRPVAPPSVAVRPVVTPPVISMGSPPVATTLSAAPGVAAVQPVAPVDSIPKIIPPPRATTANPQQMQAVAARANAMNRHAFELAEHGAIYAARSEFYESLHMMAVALDGQNDDRGQEQSHEQKLAAGLRALEEADDFAARDARSIEDLHVTDIVAGHHTPVLRGQDCERVSTRAAMAKYLTYASEQLAAAVADMPPGSMALHGLGKVYALPPASHGPADFTGGAKAIVYQEAALQVDNRNARAANELGVQLVRFGRLPEAKIAFLHSLKVAPRPAVWENLAAVHDRLGESDLASRARRTGLAMGMQKIGSAPSDVQWVDANTFAASMPVSIDPVRPSIATGVQAQPAVRR